jgi:hypothetical protein
MGLREDLTAMRLEREAKRNPEWVRIMHKATDDLGDSGIRDRVLKSGAKAPEFVLSNARGEMRGSRDWLAKGPLVLCFYRGVW